MGRIIILAFILFCSTFALSAQSVIEGYVKNKKNQPLSATITVSSKGSSIISSYTTTNDAGFYSIVYPGRSDTITLTVSGLNVGKFKKTVDRKQRRVDFVLDEKPIELKEVSIVPQKITKTGDTLNYAVGQFMNPNDRTIGSVLKNMPGIDVGPNGAISYNGKPIKKFYVENRDLLEGKYNVITNNILATDIAFVQVLENHQPINALQKIRFSDDAAINLKLKDRAKGILSISAAAGAGYKPAIWDGELTSIFFSPDMQNVIMYKGNNSGNDIKSELRNHYDHERINMNTNNYLSILSPTTPPVPQKRYLYNNSHVISGNHLHVLKDSLELTTNVSYYKDKIERDGYSLYQQYLFEDSILSIEENIHYMRRQHNGEVTFKLQSNKSKYYLTNVLSLKGNWNDESGLGITASNTKVNEKISQSLNNPTYSISNTLDLMKSIDNNILRVYFAIAYQKKAGTLTIVPANYIDNNLSAIDQESTAKDFSSILRVAYSRSIKNFLLDCSVWTRLDSRKLDTELQGKNQNNAIALSADSLRNNMNYNTYQVGIHQSCSYKTTRFNAFLALPLTFFFLTKNDHLFDKEKNHCKIMLNPSLTGTYILTEFLSLSSNINYRRTYGDISSSYAGYIMHNYRSILRNTNDNLLKTRVANVNTSVAYRDVYNLLFINAKVDYGYTWRNLLYGYNYHGIVSEKTTIQQPGRQHNLSIKLNMDKGLNFWSATVRFSGGHNNVKGEQLIQEQIVDYSTKGYEFSNYIYLRPNKYINVNNSFIFRKSNNRIINNSTYSSSLKNIANIMRLNIHLTNALTVNWNVEFQYNNSTNKRHTSFADAGFKYKYKGIETEFELNNIFNSKKYVAVLNNHTNTYYYSYNLRPLSAFIKIRFKLK